MSDREERASALFAAARSWNPVDRAMLDRVAARLESKRRFGFSRMMLVPVAVALAAAFSISVDRAPPAPADAPVRAKVAPFVAKRLGKSEAPVTASVAAKRPKPKQRIPGSMMEPVSTPLEDIVQQPILAPDVPPRAPARRQYVPRAIVDFQQPDWEWLQENDELPAYVRSIIERRDRRALLAALDRMPVDRRLRLVRGELRAGDARCRDAIADFEAVLHDDGARELHPRAASARDLCR